MPMKPRDNKGTFTEEAPKYSKEPKKQQTIPGRFQQRSFILSIHCCLLKIFFSAEKLLPRVLFKVILSWPLSVQLLLAHPATYELPLSILLPMLLTRFCSVTFLLLMSFIISIVESIAHLSLDHGHNAEKRVIYYVNCAIELHKLETLATSSPPITSPAHLASLRENLQVIQDAENVLHLKRYCTLPKKLKGLSTIIEAKEAELFSLKDARSILLKEIEMMDGELQMKRAALYLMKEEVSGLEKASEAATIRDEHISQLKDTLLITWAGVKGFRHFYSC